MVANVEKMAYAGAVPWHGQGKKVEGLMTTEEALKAAELDWEVTLEPVVVHQTVQPNWKAVVRQTDQTVFAIVGNKYTPIQNRDSFKFFDAVLGAGKATIETVGALDGGRRIWILANLQDVILIKGKDEIKKYAILTNSHDGTFAREVFNTPIRVVCQNTLQMARSGASEKFYTRHTKNADSPDKIDKAREILGIVDKYYANFKELMDVMAVKQLPAGDRPLLLAAAFGTHGAIDAADIYNPIKVQMDKVEEIIEVDRGEFAPEFHGTVYEAYNAVVKFTDYYRQYRGDKADKPNPDKRLNGVWFGGGNTIKARTLAWAANYIK